jgi:cyclic di-GMP phosphodiesterase
MLKKIKVTDARLGMYIHDIGGKWIDNPFWKKSFKLTKQKDLDTLSNCGLDELLIDTDKGLDVEIKMSHDSETIEPQVNSQTKVNKKTDTHVPIHEELVKAKKIHAKAKEAVISMFSEVRMGNALEVEGAVLLVDEISQSMARNSGAILSLIRLKNIDEYTYLHSVAVCALMVALGRQLGLEADVLRQVGVAGLLHDIGKMAIPNEVLNKPGKLTDEEFQLVMTHPRRGWETLNTTYDVSDIALDVCLHHHERMDGQGYPDKLSGEALSLFARMGAICDVYDAITSDRCYRKGWAPAESLSKMASWKEDHFDEAVFHAFVKTLGIYPNGTLLKLESGRLGVVIEQSVKSLTTPIVKVFFSTRSDAHIPMEIVDLSKDSDTISNVEYPQQWQFDLDQIQGIA